MAATEPHPSHFPTDPTEFDSDERISFSKLDNKFVLVLEDGTEFEFDDALKRWIPVLDDALLEEQQRAYAVSGVDESEPVDATRKKRKQEYVNGDEVCFMFWTPAGHECLLIGIRRMAEWAKPPRRSKPRFLPVQTRPCM